MKQKQLPELLLWTADETGAALGVSARTVKFWSASSRMPGFVKLCGRARWNRRIVEEWIEAGCPEEWQHHTGMMQDREDSETDIDDDQKPNTLEP
jgi:hypothetical protein